MVVKLGKYQSLIYNDNHRFVVAVTGRRFAKTTTSVLKLGANCLLNKGWLAAYIMPTNGMCKAYFLPIFLFYFGSKITYHNKTDRLIILKNGSQIRYGGADAHNVFRSSKFNEIHCDEFQDFPVEAWEESLSPTLIDLEGSAFLSGTPKGKANILYKMFHMADSSEHWSSHHYTTIQGGYVKQSEVDRLRHELDERSFRQELEASFEISAGAVYYTYGVHNFTDMGFNPTADTYLCWDFNVNPMSCIVNQNIDGKRYATKEFILKNANTEGTVKTVRDYLNSNNFTGRLIVTGDYAGTHRHSSASRSDYNIILMALRGFNLDPQAHIRKTKSISDRVAALNSQLKSMDGDIKQFVNVKECPKLHKDLLLVEYADDGRFNTKDKTLTHASDALSYDAYNHSPVILSRKMELV